MLDKTLIDQIGYVNLKGKLKGTNPASDPTAIGFKKYAKLGVPQHDAVFVPNSFDAIFLMALALEKAGGDKSKVSSALRSVANAPGEVIYPGEWKKAKALLDAGKDINYEGASGSLDFDSNGDVSDIYNWLDVTETGFKPISLIK